MEELLESLGILGAGEFKGRSPGRGLKGKPGLNGADKTFPSELERFCLVVGLRTPASEVGAESRFDSPPDVGGGERLFIPAGMDIC